MNERRPDTNETEISGEDGMEEGIPSYSPFFMLVQ